MLSREMRAQLRQFAVGTQITLYEIDLSPVGGITYYLTNYVFEERVPIRFAGNNYVQLAIEMSSVEVDSQGAPAQPTLSVVTSGGPINSLIAAHNDLRKAIVRRFDVFAEYLDLRPDGEGGVETNPSADSAARIKQELFIVDRKIVGNDVYAEFQLKSPFDQEGVQLPLRIVRKRWCDSEYRVSDGEGGFLYAPPADGGCPWGQVFPDGGQYYGVDNEPTTADKDECSKELAGCVRRFGQNNPLPFSAFPGVRGAQES